MSNKLILPDDKYTVSFTPGSLVWHRSLSRLGVVYYNSTCGRYDIMFFRDGARDHYQNDCECPVTSSCDTTSWLSHSDSYKELIFVGSLNGIIEDIEKQVKASVK